MKAIETTGTINKSGQLTLDKSLEAIEPQRVRIIILIDEDNETETDPDETPTEVIIEGIRKGLREALSRQTIPLSEMWTNAKEFDEKFDAGEDITQFLDLSKTRTSLI